MTMSVLYIFPKNLKEVVIYLPDTLYSLPEFLNYNKNIKIEIQAPYFLNCKNNMQNIRLTETSK